MTLLFRIILTISLAFFSATTILAQDTKPTKQKINKNDFLITLSTPKGEIKMVLFDKTPIHKENFIKLASEGFFDSTLFHRVIKNFMIQGGDPNSKPGGPTGQIGNGGPGYTLAAEMHPDLTHVKGAVAAARLGDAVNPKKESSGSQFYIVQNAKGTPHLNGGYTVFGMVIKGLETVDAIADEPVNRGSRPLTPVSMTVKVEKTKKKKIMKEYGHVYPELKKKKKKKK